MKKATVAGIIVLSLILTGGYALNSRWIPAAVSAGVGIFWLIGFWYGRPGTAPVGIFFSIGLAAWGVSLGMNSWWVLGGGWLF